MMGPVVLVDDDRAPRLAAAQTLDLAGFSVVTCDSAADALARLDARTAVLVTDLRMPGQDGFALMEQALRRDPDLPVILMTGHGDVATAVRSMRSGAFDFIEKPFPADLLVESVRRAIAHRSLLLENRKLRQEIETMGETAIIGRSPSIERMRSIIAAVADTAADVLVMGETGTGKEMVARALHQQSARRAHHFVALNCGAMPESIVESELFGHEAGAFTGAAKRRTGRIVHAAKGTLFLDEIESMPLSLQVKMLRVLQERVVEPLGSNAVVPVDLRVVAATKVSLKQASAEGSFREDLYYRLNVVMIHIPPLRERREDIPLLFQHFLVKAAARYGREPPVPDQTVLQRLQAHHWPGNVRELRNAADRMVLGLGELTSTEHPPLPVLPSSGSDGGNNAAAALSSAGHSAPLPDGFLPGQGGLAEQVDRFEGHLLEQALIQHQGNVKAVVDMLGLPRKTFYDKLRKHGLTADSFRDHQG